jgi:hypothetical protein
MSGNTNSMIANTIVYIKALCNKLKYKKSINDERHCVYVVKFKGC